MQKYAEAYMMEPCTCGHVRGDHVNGSGMCLQFLCLCQKARSVSSPAQGSQKDREGTDAR